MKDFGSTYIQTNESLTLKLVINLSFFYKENGFKIQQISLITLEILFKIELLLIYL